MKDVFNQTPSPKLAKSIPSEVYQLSILHRLGTPLKVYKDNITPCLFNLAGLLSLIYSLLLTLSLGSTLLAFYLGTREGENCVFGTLSIPATIAFNNCTLSDLGNYVYFYWMGLVLALAFLLFGIMFLIRGFQQLLYESRTYFFSQGFIVLKKGSVILQIRWDHIVTLWHTIKLRQGFRFAYATHEYSIEDIDGKEWELPIPEMIKYVKMGLIKYRAENDGCTINHQRMEGT